MNGRFEELVKPFTRFEDMNKRFDMNRRFDTLGSRMKFMKKVLLVLFNYG